MKLSVEKLGLRLSILLTLIALTATAQNGKDYASVLAEADWGWQSRNGVEYGKASFADLYGTPPGYIHCQIFRGNDEYHALRQGGFRTGNQQPGRRGRCIGSHQRDIESWTLDLRL